MTLIASNECSSDTLTLQNYITVYPFPSPQSITQFGDTLFAIAGASSYQWYFNSTIINGATNYFYVATQSGNYNLVAIDSNGCEVEAVINNVIAGLSPALSEGDGVTAFPNPVTDEFTIQKLEVTSGAAVEISVYNVVGEKINLTFDGEPLTMDCRALSPGLYYIEINSNNKIFRSKFLKQ